MIITDEKGDVEIDGKMLMDLLAEVHKMGMATGIEHSITFRKLSDKEILRRLNRVNKVTWGDKEWCKKFVSYIFQFARNEIV